MKRTIKRNYRKLVSYLLIGLTLIGLLQISPAGVMAQDGLTVLNPGFEEVLNGKPVDWSISGTAESSTEKVYNGSYSVKINDSSITDSVRVSSSRVTAVSGFVYEASVYSYNESGSSSIYLEFYDTANIRIGYKNIINSVQGSWVRLSAQGIAPSGTAYATVLLYSGKSSTGVCYFDQTSFTKLDQQLMNEGFEDVENGKPVFWTSFTPDKIEVSNQQVFEGSYSLKLNDNSSTSGVTSRSNPVFITPGLVYEASVYSYNESGNSLLYLEFYNSSDERISFVTANNSTLGQWSKMSVTAAAPAGAVYGKLLLYSSSANVGVCYFDRAGFMKLDQELLNGGFENIINGKPDFWFSDTPDKIESSSRQIHEGSYSLRLYDNSSTAGATARSNGIVVESGSTYEATVYSYNESGISQIYLEFYNTNGERIDFTIAVNEATGGWSKMGIAATAPEGAAFAKLLMYANTANVGVCYFDQAGFRKVNKELLNGNFENIENGKPVSWHSDAPDKIEASTQNIAEGIYSLKVIDSDSLPAVIRSNEIFIEQGSEYKAEVSAFNESGTSALSLEFYNISNTLVRVVKADNATVSQWNTLALSAVAPNDAFYAVLCLSTEAAGTGTIYFDKAQFIFLTDEPARMFPLQEASHPRLFFTGNDIEALKTKAADTTLSPLGTTGRDMWTGIESTARGYLTETSFTVSYYDGYKVTYPLPPQKPGPMDPPPGYTGVPYPYWTGMAKAIQQRLETLSIAYCITGEQAFADRAKEYALAVASWDTWTDASCTAGVLNSGLETAHLTMGVSTVYDILYGILPESERSTLKDAIVAKGLEPLFKDLKGKVDHNIQMLRACALGSGGAVVLGEHPSAEKYLTRATDYYQWYLDMRMASGKQEGLLYTSYALENLMRVVDQLARTTGERQLIQHPFINDFIVRWANYFLIPGGGGGVNFCDSSVTGYYYITMNVINKWLGNGNAGWYLANAKPSADPLDKFIYFNPDISMSSPDEKSTVLDEIGWAALRPGFDKDDTLLAFICNDSKLTHNHFDQNSFILATNNTQICTDAGYQDFSAGAANDFTLKYGHSTIRVDGQTQDSRGGGILTGGLLSTSCDYVKGSAAAPYVNTPLQRYDRHIVFVKPDYYVIYDDLKSDTARTYDWIMYTGNANTFEVGGNAVSIGQSTAGSELYVQKGSSQMIARFLSPAPMNMTAETYAGAESYGPYVRVGTGSPAEEQKFLTVIKAGPYEDGSVKAVDMGTPVESSGCEYKPVNVDGNSIFFYKALAVGDYVTLSFNVSQAGQYDAGALFIKSPLYGQWQTYIDGQPAGEVYDGYNSVVTSAPLFPLGSVYLSQGSHTIKLETVGKNASSGNYYTGMNAIRLTLSGSTVEKLSIDAQLLQGTGAAGATIKRGDSGELTDIVAFRDTSAQSFSIGGVDSDAEQVVVGYYKDSSIERSAMTRGTTLSCNGRTILSGSSLFSAALEYSEGNVHGVVETPVSITVSVYTGCDSKVMVNDQALESGSYSYDGSTGLVTFSVPAGSNQILLNRNATTTQLESLDLFSSDLGQHIALYVKSGELKGPLVSQLKNSLEQAAHQLNIGSFSKAVKHMEDFIKYLINPALSECITDASKAVLIAHAEALISNLQSDG